MSTQINLKQAQTMLMKKSLHDFVIEMWDTYESAEFSDCWLIEFLCECFMYSIKHFLPIYVWQDWISDADYAKLKDKTGGVCPVRDKMVGDKHTHNHNWNMPPRHSKSSILNVCGPVWAVLNCPISVASVSHTEALSTEMNAKRQKLMNSEKFKYYFGSDFAKGIIKSSASDIQLRDGGRLYSKCQISFTGFGADVIIADDLLSAGNAAKDMQVVKNTQAFFRNTLPTRLNTKLTGVIWHIQQRLAPGDIAGMIQNDPALNRIYSETILQAISENATTFIYPCSGQIHKVNIGDYLWQERFGDYTTILAETGKSVFDTQYQQNATASDLTVIKESDIHFITEEDFAAFRPLSDSVYASHDCPVKDGELNDFHGFTFGYGKDNELVIAESWEKKLAYVAEKQLMTTQQQLFPSIIQVVEDKANGASLIQDLKHDIPGIVAFNPGTNSKTQRLRLASIYVQSGAVRFVKNDKTAYLIDRLLKFPFVAHDDIIDSFSQLVLYHFTQRQNGVYTNCFTNSNIIQCENTINALTQFAATMIGETVKLLAVNTDGDKYTVVQEWSMRGLEKFEEVVKSLNFVVNILDASYENSLYNILKSNNMLIIKFNDKDKDKSLSLMKSGFYKKKILVSDKCAQTISDISKLRNTNQSIENAQYKIDGLDEGFAGCLRAIVTYQKGVNGLW